MHGFDKIKTLYAKSKQNSVISTNEGSFKNVSPRANEFSYESNKV